MSLSVALRVIFSIVLPAKIALMFRRIASVQVGPTKGRVTFTWGNA